MYNKLTKGELRIIEQARRQNEEALKSENPNAEVERSPLAIAKSILIWILVFLCLMLFGYFMLWVGHRFGA